ncbi:MAG: hypothetical protein ACJ79K_10710 [Gemmatimonadaceae bacterium]
MTRAATQPASGTAMRIASLAADDPSGAGLYSAVSRVAPMQARP